MIVQTKGGVSYDIQRRPSGFYKPRGKDDVIIGFVWQHDKAGVLACDRAMLGEVKVSPNEETVGGRKTYGINMEHTRGTFVLEGQTCPSKEFRMIMFDRPSGMKALKFTPPIESIR
jgi:hypothetical protein